MTLVEVTGTNIPVTLAIIGPIYALIWYASQRGKTENSLERYQLLSGDVVRYLPGYRNEALIFVAANMFGAGIAAVLPSGDMSAALNDLLPWTDAKLVLLMVTFVAASAMGLHPVIMVLSVSAVFPPAALGIEDWVLGLAFLGAWGEHDGFTVLRHHAFYVAGGGCARSYNRLALVTTDGDHVNHCGDGFRNCATPPQ